MLTYQFFIGREHIVLVISKLLFQHLLHSWVLNRGQFCSAGNIWQNLETFLTVGYCWLMGRCKNAASHHRQGSHHSEELSSLTRSNAKVQKPCSADTLLNKTYLDMTGDGLPARWPLNSRSRHKEPGQAHAASQQQSWHTNLLSAQPMTLATVMVTSARKCQKNQYMNRH